MKHQVNSEYCKEHDSIGCDLHKSQHTPTHTIDCEARQKVRESIFCTCGSADGLIGELLSASQGLLNAFQARLMRTGCNGPEEVAIKALKQAIAKAEKKEVS